MVRVHVGFVVVVFVDEIKKFLVVKYGRSRIDSMIMSKREGAPCQAFYRYYVNDVCVSATRYTSAEKLLERASVLFI